MALTLKEQVLQMVTSINDDETLQIIKHDIELINTKDVTSDLSASDFDELKNMVNEPFGYNTISQKQFDESINQWRSTK
jgi:hypothetical protein